MHGIEPIHSSRSSRSLTRVACSLGPALALAQSTSSAAACTSVRPTDDPPGFSYGGAAVESHAEPGDAVRVHYATEGAHVPYGFGEQDPPEGVLLARQAALEASEVFERLGFDPPVSDEGLSCSNGGDGAVDVYLLHFAAADGHAGRDDCDEASETTACSGFLVVENDFAGIGYPSVEAGYQVVVPHEFFHLVQAAYASRLPDFWSEGTAQWAAKHVYPEMRDLESYLPAYFERPNRPIDLPPSTGATPFSYGTAIWPVFLEEYFGAEVVRETFEQLRDDPDPLLAVDQVLARHDSSLADAWSTFVLYNAATGARTGAVGYRDAARYPLVASEPLDEEPPFRFEGVTSGLSATYFELADGPVRTVRIATDRDSSRGFVVPLENGVARIDAASEGEAKLEGPAMLVIAGVTPSLRDAAFAIDVTLGNEDGGSDDRPDEPDAGAEEPEAAPAPRPTLSNESGCTVAPMKGHAHPWAIGLGLLLLGTAFLRCSSRGSGVGPSRIVVFRGIAGTSAAAGQVTIQVRTTRSE